MARSISTKSTTHSLSTKRKFKLCKCSKGLSSRKVCVCVFVFWRTLATKARFYSHKLYFRKYSYLRKMLFQKCLTQEISMLSFNPAQVCRQQLVSYLRRRIFCINSPPYIISEYSEHDFRAWLIKINLWEALDGINYPVVHYKVILSYTI